MESREAKAKEEKFKELMGDYGKPKSKLSC